MMGALAQKAWTSEPPTAGIISSDSWFYLSHHERTSYDGPLIFLFLNNMDSAIVLIIILSTQSDI